MKCFTLIAGHKAKLNKILIGCHVAAVYCSPDGAMLGGAGLVFFLIGWLGRAWVGAWHGAWVGDVVWMCLSHLSLRAHALVDYTLQNNQTVAVGKLQDMYHL